MLGAGWPHLVVLLAQGVELLLPGHGVPPGVRPALRQVLDVKILEVQSGYDARPATISPCSSQNYYLFYFNLIFRRLSYRDCSSSEAFQTFI